MASDTGGNWQNHGLDMPPDVLRQYGHDIVDWIADYLEHPDRYPVLSQVKPGDIRAELPACGPEDPESLDAILSDFERIVMPGITHWNHPSFFAYFATTASGPGILAEFLAAALNANAMLWRTSPAATELEDTVLAWLRQMLGFPENFEGVMYDTASTSSLVAIAAAREACGRDVKAQGLAARADRWQPTMYCSEQAHSSIERAAIVLGLGTASVRKIATDDEFRLQPQLLQHAVEEDLQAGYRPFCCVSTVGTTSTTSVDPTPAIAGICKRYGLWLHVDAAYGGIGGIVPEVRWALDGVGQADSVVVNPHKWLFTPIDLSVLYSPRFDVVREAFSLVPEYLRTAEDQMVRNLSEYGPQLGRRFRALKLWFILRAFGRSGIESRIRKHLELAQMFAQWVDSESLWERLAPVPFSTVCFRAHPAGFTESQLDELNQAILDGTNSTGTTFLSHTRLHGRLTLRLAVGNLRTEEVHVRAAWQLLQGMAGQAINTVHRQSDAETS